MIKRLTGKTLIVLAVAVLLLCGCALAEEETTIIDSGSCGTNLTWELDSEYTLTISGEGEMEDYSLFSSAPWYSSYRTSIKEVVIEDGVTSIGNYAFHYCKVLTSITIPDGVTSFGGYAFRGCSSLTDISIPDSVTSIGNNAFRNCSSLTSISVPDGVTSIGGYAFRGCSSLTSISIPDGVTSIGNNAFYGCSSLTSISIPDGVTSIEHQTFSDCSSLTSITIADGVTSMGYEAFRNCSSLTSISIPDGVTSIGNNAFYGCSSLTGVMIPDSVTSISSSAFSRCSNLTKVCLLGETAPTYTFPFSAGEVTIHCHEFSEIDFWATENGFACVYVEPGIPETLTIVSGDEIELHLEKTLTLCVDTFPLPASKYDIVWESSAPEVATVENGVVTPHAVGKATIIASCGITAECFVTVREPNTLILPDSLIAIKAEAFKGVNAEAIVLPDGATTIGERAFANCTELAIIHMPDSIKSIADDAFDGCENVIFLCASANAAAAYAEEHGIAYRIGQ